MQIAGKLMEIGEDPEREADDGPFKPRPRALIDTGGERLTEVHGLSIEQAQALGCLIYQRVVITIERE